MMTYRRFSWKETKSWLGQETGRMNTHRNVCFVKSHRHYRK